MYSVEIRQHIMIAHSLTGAVFGPAQKVHGATYLVDVAFMRPDLSADAIVVDIGRALDALKATLAPIDYANLDDLPVFAGVNTTTEFLCKWVFDRMAEAVAEGRLGPGGDGVARLRVTLTENHLAKAAFEADLPR